MKRVYEHKTDTYKGFSQKYGCKQLIFYELQETMEAAIYRETQIKKGSRKHKLKLIENMNPEWKDQYEDII